MASNLRQKKQIDYRVLHEGESLRFGKETRSTPEVLESTFYVERLISKKRDNGKSTVQYLVKWKDFSIADCTWEPQRHLPEHVIVNFVPTQIDEDRLKVFSVAFERAVHGRLKSKNPVCSVYVDLDIYRYLFGDVSSKLCDLQDFTPLKLSDNWFYILNRDGTGKKLKFPIKLTARLCFRKMYVKQEGKLVLKTVPIEKCNLYSCTEACTMEDL